MNGMKKKIALIVFSNDMDKAMAAFILATGAASAGMEVSMYFTFWGLSLLRKKKIHCKGKTLIERMFGWMLPEGPDGAVLSKMNLFGLGTAMMKRVMRKKKMLQLSDLINIAQSLDVKIIACSTSMEMMGIKQEELLDTINVGGVATYLAEASETDINLFI
ncbi:DsrE/DsrF/DrsH-like family protein [Candidatus Latescibacterota bacterium]